jgi:hypothetical protein
MWVKRLSVNNGACSWVNTICECQGFPACSVILSYWASPSALREGITDPILHVTYWHNSNIQ